VAEEKKPDFRTLYGGGLIKNRSKWESITEYGDHSFED
jgi:hypothetical protein